MTAFTWLRFAAELAVDLFRGKLEKRVERTEPTKPGLPHWHAEYQARAAREAGPPCDRPPPGWRCSRMRGHPGPCAAEPISYTTRR